MMFVKNVFLSISRKERHALQDNVIIPSPEHSNLFHKSKLIFFSCKKSINISVLYANGYFM